MPRLPQPDGDAGRWGTILNDFLRQSHNDDGSLSKVDGNLTKLQLRRGTAAEWTAQNPILVAGEIGLETDTNNRKTGNGTQPWNGLPYELTEGVADGRYALVHQVYSAVTPEAYGAIGDGIADDTVALQTALNAGAGGLVVLAGTYGFSETLTVSTGTRVEGGGVLQLLSGYSLMAYNFRGMGDPMYPYLLVDKDGVSIRDLTIKGTTSDTRVGRHVGLLFADCENGRAENVNISYINWDPTLAGSTGESLGYTLGTVRASKIAIRGGRHEFGGYQTIGIADGSRSILVDNVYCGTGWRTSLQIHRDVWDVDIVNSTIENVQPTADSAFTIHPSPDTGAPTGRVRVGNTRIRGIVNSSAGNRGGIQLVSTIDGISLKDVEIESNRWGIYLLANGASLNNVCITSEYMGLHMGGSNLSVEGGRYVVTEVGGQYGIEVMSSTLGVRISRAFLDSPRAGARIVSSDDVSVHGCSVRGGLYAIWISGSASKRISLTDNVVLSLSDNTIYHNTTGDGIGETLIIRGNTITAPSNRRCILINSPLTGVIIQGNIALGGLAGVRITALASKALVKDNNVLATTNGLDINAPDSIVEDNLV